SQSITIEACRNFLIQGCVREQVASQLLDRELIEGQVPIQSLDDPLAVPPGVRARLVLLVAITVGVTRQVEPWTSPLLSVMIGAEQAIDDALIRLWRAIGQKGRNVLRCWWQSDQIKADSANQRCSICLTRRRKMFLLESLKNESVDWVSYPASVAD